MVVCHHAKDIPGTHAQLPEPCSQSLDPVYYISITVTSTGLCLNLEIDVPFDPWQDDMQFFFLDTSD